MFNSPDQVTLHASAGKGSQLSAKVLKIKVLNASASRFQGTTT
jgi:hypothetical protein